MKDAELILLIAKSIVDKPEQVSVSQIDADQSTVFELKVDKADIGKVIGKQGRTAQAIRTILSARGAMVKKRMILEILEPR